MATFLRGAANLCYSVEAINHSNHNRPIRGGSSSDAKLISILPTKFNFSCATCSSAYVQIKSVFSSVEGIVANDYDFFATLISPNPLFGSFYKYF